MQQEFSPEPVPATLPTHSLTTLRPRIRRAADSARRSGPEGATLLRRSMAVYAESACGSRVPEEWFLTAIQRELMDVLKSRVSMRRLAILMDAAAQGALDGYEQHERLAGHDVRSMTPGGISIVREPDGKSRSFE